VTAGVISVNNLRHDASGVLLTVQGKEYPDRFFAYDFAGNRLEFAVHAM
jgi:hypothetical protein